MEKTGEVEFTRKDLEDLERTKRLLEGKSLATKLTEVLGKPIEQVFNQVPQGLRDKIGEITEKALTYAINIAIFTLNKDLREKAFENLAPSSSPPYS